MGIEKIKTLLQSYINELKGITTRIDASIKANVGLRQGLDEKKKGENGQVIDGEYLNEMPTSREWLEAMMLEATKFGSKPKEVDAPAKRDGTSSEESIDAL